MTNETICAISTAPGVGGIAVIRISGPEAIAICDRLFQARRAGKTLSAQPAYSLTYGTLAEGGETIDDVMMALFRAPHSFTGEDTVEITCHGSTYIQQRVLRALVATGCRLAKPGEFTQRAFMNGKMDLSQAEAVADLIASTFENGEQKINAAYSYGGPEQAINTINRNLDLNITDFATVNFKALADAVDILGGIQLTIQTEKELDNLNDYIGNMNKINGGDSPKFDEVGTYTFDGNQAVAYSRIRYMEGGDHERANHQRLVVEGIISKVKRQPWKLKALADTVIPECKTSFSTSDMTALAMGLLRYNIEDSQAYQDYRAFWDVTNHFPLLAPGGFEVFTPHPAGGRGRILHFSQRFPARRAGNPAVQSSFRKIEKSKKLV